MDLKNQWSHQWAHVHESKYLIVAVCVSEADLLKQLSEEVICRLVNQVAHVISNSVNTTLHLGRASRAQPSLGSTNVG